jgi:hypothetical protein
VQVSRLGMPLVNEVVVGLKDKDKFNASQTQGRRPVHRLRDPPHAAALLEIALASPGIAPTNFPRNDLVTTFLTGIKGVNQPAARDAVGDAAPEHGHRTGAFASRTGWASSATSWPAAVTTQAFPTAAGPRTTSWTSHWWR